MQEQRVKLRRPASTQVTFLPMIMIKVMMKMTRTFEVHS
jgi:hypothetical protein